MCIKIPEHYVTFMIKTILINFLICSASFLRIKFQNTGCNEKSGASTGKKKRRRMSEKDMRQSLLIEFDADTLAQLNRLPSPGSSSDPIVSPAVLQPNAKRRRHYPHHKKHDHNNFKNRTADSSGKTDSETSCRDLVSNIELDNVAETALKEHRNFVCIS